MTILKAVNVFFFQWFFVRLTRCTEERVESYSLNSFHIVLNNGISSEGIGEIIKYQWYTFQY